MNEHDTVRSEDDEDKDFIFWGVVVFLIALSCLLIFTLIRDHRGLDAYEERHQPTEYLEQTK